VAEIHEHLRNVEQESWFPAPALVDARFAAPAVSGADVRGIVARLVAFGERMRDAPIAVVVSSDLGYGLVRMIGLLLDDRISVLPFRELTAADAWLARGPASPPGSH
ncbi:MAG TPA: hypothetical protein VMJ30_02955, partial [Gemmatimonadales bacterium]|nr:hypothetical protein [Gemmatimonadales bacterium]